MDNNWKLDLEEYIRQGEPDQAGRSAAWKTAIGLQDVDGLKTSEYPCKIHSRYLADSSFLRRQYADHSGVYFEIPPNFRLLRQ